MKIKSYFMPNYFLLIISQSCFQFILQQEQFNILFFQNLCCHFLLISIYMTQNQNFFMYFLLTYFHLVVIFRLLIFYQFELKQHNFRIDLKYFLFLCFAVRQKIVTIQIFIRVTENFLIFANQLKIYFKQNYFVFVLELRPIYLN